MIVGKDPTVFSGGDERFEAEYDFGWNEDADRVEVNHLNFIHLEVFYKIRKYLSNDIFNRNNSILDMSS